MSHPDPAVIIKKLQQAFASLQNIMMNHHGVLRGTAEASLAESQGLRLLNSANPSQNPHFHYHSLSQAMSGLRNALATIDRQLLTLRNASAPAAQQLTNATAPIVQLARERLGLLQRVEELCMELRITHANRLSGMSRIIVTGPRTMGNLVSQQLINKGGVPLIPPGIVRQWQVVMSQVHRLPLNLGQAAAQVGAAMAVVRAALQNVAQMGGRSFLARFFGGLLNLLMNIGGRLIMLPIIIVPPGTLEDPLHRRRPDIA